MITDLSRKRVSAFRGGRVPAMLAVLALTGLGISASAGEPAAQEPQEAASEKNAESGKNMLRWSTASEVDNFGYHVYRGESEDGPFERLTADPLLGAGTTDEPSHYEFVDDTVEPGVTYWYYVESISKRGKRKRFTPIFRKRPKGAPEAESEAEEGGGDPR